MLIDQMSLIDILVCVVLQQITAGLVFGTVSAAAWHALCQHNIVRRVLEPVLRPFKSLVPHLKEP